MSKYFQELIQEPAPRKPLEAGRQQSAPVSNLRAGITVRVTKGGQVAAYSLGPRQITVFQLAYLGRNET